MRRARVVHYGDGPEHPQDGGAGGMQGLESRPQSDSDALQGEGLVLQGFHGFKTECHGFLVALGDMQVADSTADVVIHEAAQPTRCAVDQRLERVTMRVRIPAGGARVDEVAPGMLAVVLRGRLLQMRRHRMQGRCGAHVQQRGGLVECVLQG